MGSNIYICKLIIRRMLLGINWSTYHKSGIFYGNKFSRVVESMKIQQIKRDNENY